MIVDSERRLSATHCSVWR